MNILETCPSTLHDGSISKHFVLFLATFLVKSATILMVIRTLKGSCLPYANSSENGRKILTCTPAELHNRTQQFQYFVDLQIKEGNKNSYFFIIRSIMLISAFVCSCCCCIISSVC